MRSQPIQPGNEAENQTVQCTSDEGTVYPTVYGTLYDEIPEVIQKRSPRLCRVVNRVFTGQLRKGFHSVHLLNRPPQPLDGPLIVFLNHPSWNDPMLISFLHYHFFPEREAYGPIDAEAMKGYGFFARVGLYGVTHGNAGGARRFLRTSLAILERPGTAIWITAQGKFSDPRERPVVLEAGLASLLKIWGEQPVTVLPLAVEYAYGEEKLPEIFVNFGKPVEMPGKPSVGTWKSACEKALETAQDELAENVIAKEMSEFSTILGGSIGVGGVYGLWQRFKAMIQGKKYDPSHGSLTKTP